MFKKEYSLKELNTFGMDVMAEHFAIFGSADALVEQLHEIAGLTTSSKSILVLGGGSNILFTKDVKGFVLKNNISGIEKSGEDNSYVYMKAGAGESWHGFVMHCIEHGYAGVENLALIPGSVGASPMQNIGAYGVELKDVFHSLEAIDIHTGETVVFNKSDCGFGYRESVFKNIQKNKYIITSVTYRLNKNPSFHIGYGAIREELDNMNITSLTIRDVANAVIKIRRSKLPDPAIIGNAGSFFKNPEMPLAMFDALKEQFPGIIGYPVGDGHMKVAAGWLIEHSGPEKGMSWKGYRRGDAGCHAMQALVLVNYGKAKGSEVYSLSQQIQASVQEKFGIELQVEVNII